MPIDLSSAGVRRGLRAVAGLLLAALLAALAPSASSASVTTFGSPLSVPATLNTAEDLGYSGTYTAVPPAPDAPNGVFHTFHYGADTAIWNFSGRLGETRVPATGQAVKIELEGCAMPAPGGPRPLTTIHFQTLTPLPGGGARVDITSQGFDIPVCGEAGASGSTITTYLPINLCVQEGDFVGLNDSGGYVPNVYRNGVPYEVLGAVQGATIDSFIKDQGTGNGALLTPGATSANDGFAVNRNEELMMRVTLGTGADATHVCPGGSAGRPPPLAPLKVRPQTDGVNHSRIIAVAIYCRPVSGCRGQATLALAGRTASYGRAVFRLPGNKTSHVSIRVSSRLMGLIRRSHGVSAVVTAVMDGRAFSQTILVRIL